MAAYHHLLVHIPIALLSVALLIILLRFFSTSELARRLDSVLLYTLILGIGGGLLAMVGGLLIWPIEAATTSPMGRNKILVSGWMLACWVAVLFLRWRGGESVWDGAPRYAMLGLGALGGILLAITGTLGGQMLVLGSPSGLSALFHKIGWDAYHTYYAPSWVLAVLAAVGVAGLVIGLLGTRKTAS